MEVIKFRSNPTEIFLRKGVLKICSKLRGEHPCRSVISIKLESNFIEIAPRHGCSLVNLLDIFRTPFLKNTSGGLLVQILYEKELSLKFAYMVNENILKNTALRETYSKSKLPLDIVKIFGYLVFLRSCLK